MIHPYIDWARRLAAAGIDSSDVREIVCETAEGIVHRLWEPLEAKRRPPNGYGAKFSVPFCIAYAMLHGDVGLEAFSDRNASDPRITALAAKVSYVIDPDNPYPDEYTGHLRVTRGPGASRNIGRAIALALADAGAAVVVNARRSIDEARAVAKEIESRGGRALASLADVTDERAVAAMTATTLERFGRLDILV